MGRTTNSVLPVGALARQAAGCHWARRDHGCTVLTPPPALLPPQVWRTTGMPSPLRLLVSRASVGAAAEDVTQRLRAPCPLKVVGKGKCAR